MIRYVRKDRRIYDFSLCKACGTAWGGYPSKYCPRSTCLACSTPQCLGNGLGGGTCSICYRGLLPGWSGTDKPCGYKGCGERAVSEAPRVRYVCKSHLARVGLDKSIERALVERDKHWMALEVPDYAGERANPAGRRVKIVKSGDDYVVEDARKGTRLLGRRYPSEHAARDAARAASWQIVEPWEGKQSTSHAMWVLRGRPVNANPASGGVCSSCRAAAAREGREMGARGMRADMIARQMGADISDHVCDARDKGKSCVCACRRVGRNPRKGNPMPGGAHCPSCGGEFSPGISGIGSCSGCGSRVKITRN